MALGLALASLASMIALVVNNLLAASYYVQRTGINQAFVDQLNLNVRYLLSGYTDILLGGTFYVLLTTALIVQTVVRMHRADSARTVFTMMPWFLASLILFTPVAQTLDFKLGDRNSLVSLDEDFPDQLAEPAPHDSSKPANSGKNNKSLVLIYLEGLEMAYFDVPGLMPELSKLRERMLVFTNIREGVGGTIGGLVSTQCGWPPFSDVSIYTDESFYPGFRCLGDFLEDAGFTSVFMGGADLRFTRKDLFFGTHGFSKVLGKNELVEKLPDPGYQSKKWGLYDDSLFLLGREVFHDLVQQGERFSLVFLTIATHTPGFPAPSCRSFPGSDLLILQAVHCTDHLVAQFIHDVRESDASDDTIIALFSDHLMWGGISDQGITIDNDDRRLTFMIDVPGSQPKVSDVAGTEVDVGPTLASLLGLDYGARIGLGSSLLSQKGYLFSLESELQDWRQIRSFLRSDAVKTRVEQARHR